MNVKTKENFVLNFHEKKNTILLLYKPYFYVVNIGFRIGQSKMYTNTRKPFLHPALSKVENI